MAGFYVLMLAIKRHYDHVAAMAEMKRLTGARVLARVRAAVPALPPFVPADDRHARRRGRAS